MAKYKSLFKVRGSLGDVNFFKGKNGYGMRSKGGVSKERIENDPAFVRTRENNNEFGNCATSGKILRHAIVDLTTDAKDGAMNPRLLKTMFVVKNADLISVRGQRNVAAGLETPDGKLALKGFNFNISAPLSTILLSDYMLDTATGVITINGFVPEQHLVIPEGATNVALSAAMMNLDMSTEEKDLQMSNIENLPINNTATDITLTPAAVAAGTGQMYYFLKVVFYQELNGLQYPLKNGAFNALQLLVVV